MILLRERANTGRIIRTPLVAIKRPAKNTRAEDDFALATKGSQPDELHCLGGLSFFVNGDGIVGIDLDECIDPITKKRAPWAVAIIERFNSYTETSPSGLGIRIFVRGKLPKGHRCKKGSIEVYSTNKPLTVTGNRIVLEDQKTARIADRSKELLAWHREVFGAAGSTNSTKEKHSSDGLILNRNPIIDPKRLEQLFKAKPKAKAIYKGDWKDIPEYASKSQSEVEMTLINFACHAGWPTSKQELLNLLVIARNNGHSEKGKAESYFIDTINKAWHLMPTIKARKDKGGAVAKDRTPDKDRSAATQHLINISRGTDDNQIAAPESSDGDLEEVEGSTMADLAELIKGVNYLLKGWIPYGMITGLLAEPGVGKSAFALWLMKTIVSGCNWFNGMTWSGEPRQVLWCGTEGDLAITIDRIRKWAVPPDRIRLPFKDPLQPINLADSDDIGLIERLVRKHQIPAVVIDSLRGGHDGDENNSRVYRVLQNLTEVAQRTKVAMIVVHHSRKLMPGEELTANSSRGSNAILALMRSQIGFDRPDPRDKKAVRVRVLKENLGLAPPPIGFRVTESGLVFESPPELPTKRSAVDEAKQFLTTHLQPNEWQESSELIDKAKQQGISEPTLHRAKTELAIKTEKKGSNWHWRREISGS